MKKIILLASLLLSSYSYGSQNLFENRKAKVTIRCLLDCQKYEVKTWRKIKRSWQYQDTYESSPEKVKKALEKIASSFAGYRQMDKVRGTDYIFVSLWVLLEANTFAFVPFTAPIDLVKVPFVALADLIEIFVLKAKKKKIKKVWPKLKYGKDFKPVKIRIFKDYLKVEENLLHYL